MAKSQSNLLKGHIELYLVTLFLSQDSNETQLLWESEKVVEQVEKKIIEEEDVENMSELEKEEKGRVEKKSN